MKKYLSYIARSGSFRCFLYGLLLPLAFAPFHIPGMAILSLGLFYLALNQLPNAQNSPRALSEAFSKENFASSQIPSLGTSKTFYLAFKHGLAYGLGFFLFGASWIYVSIHVYGHLTSIVSLFITFMFTLYLALFSAGMAVVHQYLRLPRFSLGSAIAFAALWTGAEYLRATVFTGFPWLLVGFGQIDAPSRSLLPIIGVYGVSFITALAGGCLLLIIKKTQQLRKQQQRQRRVLLTGLFVFLLLGPELLSQKNQTTAAPNQLSVAVIQANLSMRDKWDEQLFWRLLKQYQDKITTLLGTDLVVLPESAIPIPAPYIKDILKQLNKQAKQAGSSILLGIPIPTDFNDNLFYNALIALGQGKGTYYKQHLVPFGEYMPKPLNTIAESLQLPDANMYPGNKQQPLITVKQLPIATLICYELAYGNLLREQLPSAQLLVSISDDGWFGHSLAMYQHQQIAQVQSLQANRYQVTANNDGLSSVIDAQGNLVSFLAPHTSGILKASITPGSGSTPWVTWGDSPALATVTLICLYCLARRFRKPALTLSPFQADGVKSYDP